MIKNNSSIKSAIIIIIGLLGIDFVVLKLTNVINWSWFYVTMPFWFYFALFCCSIALLVCFKFIRIFFWVICKIYEKLVTK